MSNMNDKISGIQLKGLITDASMLNNQKMSVGDAVMIDADTKLHGHVRRPGVVVVVHKNQYVVVKAEGIGTPFTIKKNEVTVVVPVPEEQFVPRVPTMIPSKKAFHVVYDAENDPKPIRIRLRYDSAVHTKFNPEKMFHPIWETSNLFDMVMPDGSSYGEISVFGSDDQGTLRAVGWFEQIGRSGLISKNLPNTGAHRIISGDWAMHGIAMVVPVDSGVRSLIDLGVHLTMHSPSDELRVRKCFRRIRAHHEWAVSGSVVGSYAASHGNVLTIGIEDDKTPFKFDVLHVDINKFSPENKAMCDGVHLISTSLCRILGLKFGIEKLKEAEVGDCFKGTMFSKLGLGKGFFHVVEMDRFKIIVFGPKTQVTFDRFFLGSLGDVKGGEAFTDLQSLGAFINPETPLWSNQAKLFVNEVMESLHNEDRLRHLFLTHIQPMADRKDTGAESWVLVEALRYGVPILKNPGLFRRVVKHLMTQVLNCERGRIPYGTVAHRYNLMPDLNCFDLETGDVDFTKSVIPEGAVCCMDAAVGPFVMYRQPLGNAKEAVVTTNIHQRRFKAYVGRERVILGPSGVAAELGDDDVVVTESYLQTMGGADFDDAVVGTDNIDWVEVIAKADYPLTKLGKQQLATAFPSDNDNRFLQQRKYPAVWSMQDFFDATAKATEQSLSIGPIDNAVRLDLLLSGPHKESMLTDLAKRIEMSTGDTREKLVAAFNWLEARKDYQLREVASNLEAFIDFIKLGKGDPMVLAPLVDKTVEIRDGSLVLPECWSYLGGGAFGRIPVARYVAQDYVQAPSLVCKTLNEAIYQRDNLLEALKEEEWKMVERIPASLETIYPRNRDLQMAAFQIRSQWRDTWTASIEDQIDIAFGKTQQERTAKMFKCALDGGIVPLKDGTKKEIIGIRQTLNELAGDVKDEGSPELRMLLSVEIARQTYRTRYQAAMRDERGRRRTFPDGLLWTNTIGLFYIEALKEAGLTGLYLPVKFDRYSRNYSRNTVVVKTYKGDVILKSNGFQLGHVVGEVVPPDGEYTMKEGMLCVIVPAKELTQPATSVDETFSDPLDLGSADSSGI